MKKKFTKILGIGLVLALLVSLLLTVAPVSADKPGDGTTIQDGVLLDAKDNLITVGYDQWGYNYQAHMFNGFYENNARPDTPVTESDT